jgi:hypothetical protein
MQDGRIRESLTFFSSAADRPVESAGKPETEHLKSGSPRHMLLQSARPTIRRDSYVGDAIGVKMFAVTGITGQVGSSVARNLLGGGESVRAVVRNTAKAVAWAQQGCDVFRADMNDVDALSQAFFGVEGVFVLLPPNFDPSPRYPRVEADHCCGAQGPGRRQTVESRLSFDNRSSGN